jgi:hypothetical protein
VSLDINSVIGEVIPLIDSEAVRRRCGSNFLQGCLSFSAIVSNCSRSPLISHHEWNRIVGVRPP